MNSYSFVLIDSHDLAGLMLNSTSDQSSTHDDVDGIAPTTTVVDRSNLNDEQKPILINTDHDRQYCLIIFNNPDWSRKLRKTPQKTEPPRTQGTTNQSETTTAKGEKQDNSLDELFITRLRQLINEYMQRTKRPFPIKYFIDFSNQ